ncbi:MAG: carboxypeptidase-like regulatory domain-containing protein [Pyrodictiaceae archaeon]
MAIDVLWLSEKLTYLAMSLSVLTYYIGILLIALPVPMYSVKKWGYTLIEDGLVSALLIMLTGFILSTINYLSTLLGASKNVFMDFVMLKEDEILLVLVTLRGIASLLGLASLGFVSAFFTPIISITTMSISLLTALTVIAVLAFNYAGFFISLGSMLYALPFRIGRTAGATLIAFTVVFNIGLPLLPQWFSLFEESMVYYANVRLTEGEPVSISGVVNAGHGSPVGAVVIIEDLDTGSRSYFITTKGGLFSSKAGAGFLLPGHRYSAKVVFLGEEIAHKEFEVPREYKGTFKISIWAPGVSIIRGSIIVKPSVGCNSYTITMLSAKEFKFTCMNPKDNLDLELTYPKSCNIIPMHLEGAFITDYSRDESNWLGVNVVREYFTLIVKQQNANNTERVVSMVFNITGDCEPPRPRIVSLIEPGVGVDTISKMIIMLSYEWIILFIATISYLSILSMITYGLAYALGAWRPRMLFPFL